MGLKKLEQWFRSIRKNRSEHEKLRISCENLHIEIERTGRKFTPPPFLNGIEIHLAQHCNLNCFSCSHFSQLAEEEYYNKDMFEKDIKRLAEITDGLVKNFRLMGGEPLLNKECKDYFYITRKYFPKSQIWLVTNGILLPKQDESFWIACKENNIEIRPTKYPISVDWEKVKEKCNKYDIPLLFYNDGELSKTSLKFTLDPKGEVDAFSAFKICGHPNNCTQLNNGKLYLCPIIAYIRYFNKHFMQNLELTKFDYIDIHNPSVSFEQITSFVAKPSPFCRYCDMKKTHQSGRPWLRSKKDIYEYYEKD